MHATERRNRTMHRLNRVFSVAMIGVLMLLVGCSPNNTVAPNNEIKVGVIFPMTGDAGSYGERGRNGITLAVDEINAKGGVAGRKIQAIIEDSKADPKTGVSAMTKLTTVDQVPVVIGDIVSAVTLAAAPIAQSSKVVLLSPTSSAPAITEAGDYVFRIWPSDLAEGRAIATFAHNAGFKNVGILYMQNEYGVAIQDVFTKTLSGLGGQVTDALAYKPDESDFRSYLTKLAAKKPDAIYFVSYYKDGALAMKQAREIGVQSQFLGTTAIEDPKVFEVGGNALDGVIYPLASGFDVQSSNETVKTFVNAYKSRFQSDPDWVPAQCYDAMMLVAARMGKGETTGPELQKALAGTKGYQGVTGEITFDENGDVVKPVTIKVIKGGSFQKYPEKAVGAAG